LSIFIAKRDQKRSELEFRQLVEDTINFVELDYFTLIASEEAVKVQELAVELADRLVAENRRRVEVGAMAPLEEKQAESEAAARRADLIEARRLRDLQQRSLKGRLSDDYSEWINVDIHPTESLLAIPQSLNIQESWQKGWGWRTDVAISRLELEKQEQRVKYQKNQLYPQLDLFGGYGYSGFDQEVSGSLGQIRDRDNPNYSYGAVLTIPLANTSARNAYKIEKLRKEQSDLAVKRIEQIVMIQIEDAIAAARSNFERVGASRKARLTAEEALNAEEIKLEKGKSTNFEVLTLQKRLTDARLEEIRALTAYNISLANIAWREGQVIQRHKISIDYK